MTDVPPAPLVTKPELSTVATVMLSLLQVPDGSPLVLSWVVAPWAQIVVVPPMVPALGVGLTDTCTLEQAEGVQPGDSHLAKYWVVKMGFGMFSGVPVPIGVPPQLPLYQARVVPEPPTALRLRVPPVLEQRPFASVPAEAGNVGRGFTVTVTLTQVEGVQPVDSHLA